MKRFRRIHFNVLTAMSLLLAIVTCGIAIRSKSYQDIFYVSHCTDSAQIKWSKELTLITDRGSAQIGYHSFSGAAPWLSFKTGFDAGRYCEKYVHTGSLDPFLLADFRRILRIPASSVEPARYDLMFRFPLWTCAIVLAFLPILRVLAKFLARRVRTPNLCPACGYDTRANPVRCSECGLEIVVKN